MARKRPEILSVEDHKRVADELRTIDDALARIYEIIDGKVPESVARQAMFSSPLNRAAIRLCADMENEMFRHNKDHEIFADAHKIYWGIEPNGSVF
jgi:hypothetical protein